MVFDEASHDFSNSSLNNNRIMEAFPSDFRSNTPNLLLCDWLNWDLHKAYSHMEYCSSCRCYTNTHIQRSLPVDGRWTVLRLSPTSQGKRQNIFLLFDTFELIFNIQRAQQVPKWIN